MVFSNPFRKFAQMVNLDLIWRIQTKCNFMDLTIRIWISPQKTHPLFQQVILMGHKLATKEMKKELPFPGAYFPTIQVLKICLVTRSYCKKIFFPCCSRYFLMKTLWKFPSCLKMMRFEYWATGWVLRGEVCHHHSNPLSAMLWKSVPCQYLSGWHLMKP